MIQRFSFLPPGAGPNYDRANDHTFVKVSSRDTGGAYTPMEDNLKASFALGLHVHRQHAETFYILDGSVGFSVEDSWVTAEAGATLHVPPGVPHASMLTPTATSGRMRMVFQPAGFESYLAELAALSEADFADEATMAALNERHDIIQLGPVPPRL